MTWVVANKQSSEKIDQMRKCILTPIKQRNFARLLVGHREGILEPAVTIPELVTSPLFRLDALAANGLAAHICTASGAASDGGEVGVLIIVITVLVLGRPPARCLGASGRSRDGVVTVRARHRCGERRRVAATSSAETTRLHTVRRHFTTAQRIERGGRDAVVRGGVRTCGGGGGVRRGIRIVAEVIVHVRRVKVK